MIVLFSAMELLNCNELRNPSLRLMSSWGQLWVLEQAMEKLNDKAHAR